LAQDGAGPLRFLKDLARFVGIAEGIAAQQQALCVAENAGERVAELVSNAGDHLTELGEFVRLQQLGLEDALRGEVAVDFHAAEEHAFFVKDGTRGALQQARNRADQLQFFSQGPFGAVRQTTPILGESYRRRRCAR